MHFKVQISFSFTSPGDLEVESFFMILEAADTETTSPIDRYSEAFHHMTLKTTMTADSSDSALYSMY